MVDYLSAEDLHRIALGVVGEHVLVADWGLLASAAARPQSSAFGQDAYPSVSLKAAALLHSIVSNHALVDGNKRLGWGATVVFFELNDVDLAPPSTQAYVQLVLSIADGTLQDVNKIEGVLGGWLRSF